jgi:TatD family-associated radical SAM protein
MVKKDLTPIAAIVFPQKNLAFDSTRIILNFVPRGECTNSCLFCAPNIPEMEKAINHSVLLEGEYTIEDYLLAVEQLLSKNKDISEIIITGTIGEPLLYFEKLLKLVSSLKKIFPIKVRLNTNGQARIIFPKLSSKEVSEALEKTGLDSIVISLNAINEKDYIFLCRPKKTGAFESVLDFVKSCNESGIQTFVSFVDYSNIKHPTYPKIDKDKIKGFCKKLGLEEKHIIYRPMLE